MAIYSICRRFAGDKCSWQQQNTIYVGVLPIFLSWHPQISGGTLNWEQDAIILYLSVFGNLFSDSHIFGIIMDLIVRFGLPENLFTESVLFAG